MMNQAVTTNDNLRRVCQQHGLERYINLNPSSRGVVSPRAMYDSMKAILGAIAEDGGVDALRGVMRHLGLLV